MTQRMDLAKTAPEVYQAMFALEKYILGSELPHTTYHLVKLRASQLNGCAFCVDMHSFDMKAAGETDARIFGLAAWRESPHYTPEERAALAYTEAATRLTEGGVPDDVWEEVREHYTEAQTAALVAGVVAINAWNRIAVPTRMVPRSYQEA
ncbi:carboxymuconolactone decarboxylase family protein [Bailinhaonella thermotolerans]|uniref:Carboxymuconolactone decarboxylase family protein n=1 Tax=Bailinhaonella thermotolerans TaxID=1070861 RepID=A0A3A4AS54_9ACTN|nr:carboxymuconolactone decarboxylase family protein [Bailinhaonella thermotolerans]RJL32031.1 carboxymuconolactone decarboxylase family protein [Bailinhaonella thermotolerans]